MDEPHVARWWRAARSRPGWLVLPVQAGIAVAMIVLLAAPSGFSATAAVLVGYPTVGPSDAADRPIEPRALGSEVELITAVPVRSAVENDIGPHQVDITVDEDADVVSVSVRAPSAELAADGANAYVAVYTDRRRNSVVDSRRQQSEALAADVAATRAEVERLAAAATGDLAGASSVRELELRRSELAELLLALDQAELEVVEVGVEPMGTATAASARPMRRWSLAAAVALAGVLAGIGAPLLRGRADRTVRHPNDLGDVVSRAGRIGRDPEALPLLAATMTGVVEITSPDDPTAASRLTASLAQEIARQGASVTVVSSARPPLEGRPADVVADLRRRFDVVLIDAAPLAATVWAETAPRCFIVARTGKTQVATVRELLAELASCRAGIDRVLLT